MTSRRLGAAVRWTATRSESLLSDEQGRSLDAVGELDFDEDGVFQALRVRYDINIGAPLGVRHFDMPATPHRIWLAIASANRTGT